MSHRLVVCSAMLLFSLLMTACNGEPAPVKVSGSVSLDSKPLADGVILFSTPGKTPDSLTITNGKFEGNVKPGEKHVEIVGYGKPDAPAAPLKGEQPPAPDAKVNILPARYNEQSKLKATVSASGALEPSKFELQSK